MKFHSLFISTAACLQNLNGVFAENTTLRGNTNKQQHPSIHHRVLEEDTYAKFAIKVAEDGPDGGRRLRKLQGNSPNKETLSIETADGLFYDVVNAPNGWGKGKTAGVTVIRIPKGAKIVGDTIDMGGQAPEEVAKPFDRLLEENHAETTPEQRRNLAELKRQHRELAIVEGINIPVLAVKVINTATGTTTTSTKETIADNVFGTAIPGGSDLVNLHSQYLDCSHGKLDFQPSNNLGNPTSSTPSTVSNIVNGVVEVTVNVPCSGSCDGTIRNEVNTALGNAFGSAIRGGSAARHVMHCLPPNSMGGIAYAYINSWNSVYSDRWCEYTSTQLHEIGHNLNLAHANEGSTTYADQSGFMGYSYSQDDQRMCFNNAKNWQLGWFDDQSRSITVGESYNGKLIGQVNYSGSLANGAVVVKVDDPSSPDAFYIGFNHKVKHNSQSVEAGNQVTIQSYAGTGYAESWIIGKLSAGETWSRDLGTETVTVTVGTIDTNQDTGYADIQISYGEPAGPPPTATPTTKPTSSPTRPTTSPTSAPTKSPVPPTPPPTSSPTLSPTDPPTPSPTVFLCSTYNGDQTNCELNSDKCDWFGKNVKECRDKDVSPPGPEPTPTPPTPSPPTGQCDLLQSGASCSASSQCCSGNCKGKSGSQTCK